MKKTTLLYLCLIYTITASSQSYDWAFGFGSADADELVSLDCDANGNVVSTGYFRDSADFDPGSGTAILNTMSSTTDIFIQKVDVTGKYIWAKKIGSTLESEFGKAIATDGSGNIYLMGDFKNSIDLDPSAGVYTVNTPNITHRGLFFAKYNSSGDILWGKYLAHPFSGYNYPGKCKMVVDKTGKHIYMVYSYGNTTKYSTVNIHKYDSQGNKIWDTYISSFGGSSPVTYMIDQSITLDNNDNVIVSGTFAGDALLNPGSSTVTNSFGETSFVVKLDDKGNFIFSRIIENIKLSSGSQCYDVAADKYNNIYLVGRFGGTVDFDPGVGVAKDSMAYTAGTSMYILKLTPTGNFAWVNTYGTFSQSNNYITAVETDSKGDVYATGYFGAAVLYFDLANAVMYRTGTGTDAFILKVNSQGQYAWVEQLISQGFESGVDICINKSNDEVYIGGVFGDNMNVQYYSKINTVINTNGGFDAFIYKLNGCAAIDTTVSKNTVILTAQEAGADSYQWIDCRNLSAINGANGQSYSATANGDYAVVITKGGCSDTSACHNVSGVGVNDVNKSPVVSIYPNPVGGILDINLGETYEHNVKLVLINAMGQVLIQESYDNIRSIQLPVHHLTTGVYSISLSVKGQLLSRSKITKL